MRIGLFGGPVVLAAFLAAGAAHAQAPAAPVTDVGPIAAEERDSNGAVVLENSLVRAQRNKAFAESSSRTGVGTVGRGVVRAKSRAEVQGELASARKLEAEELYRRGAGSLTQN